MSHLQNKIYETLEEILSDCGKSATKDQNLFQAGIIDSLGMLDLVEEVEARFGFEIKQSDVTIDNFETLESMEKFIRRSLERSE